MNTSSNDTPQLLYAGACPRCQWISKVLVTLSLGSMTRIPLDRAEADDFYRKRPEARGRPALVEGDRMTYGWQVLLSVPRLLVRIWWNRLAGRSRRADRAPSSQETR